MTQTAPTLRAEQAVLIAKDALAQLEAKKLIATEMTYLEVEDSRFRETLTGEELTEKTCRVCAQGALVVGYMTRRQEEALGDYDDREEELAEIFGPRNLDLVEACFEGFATASGVGYAYEKRFGDPEVRLQKILQNIVRNGGEFRPQEDLDETP